MRVPEMFSDQITFNTYKYAFQLFPFYSFDNDDMKSSKRHAVLLSLIFLLKSLMTVSKNNKYGARFFKENTVSRIREGSRVRTMTCLADDV